MSRRILAASLAWLVLLSSCHTGGPASRSTPTDEQAMISRGQNLRHVLIEAMEQAYECGDFWPKALSLGEHSDDWLYVRPPLELAGKRGAIGSGVVLREYFELHPGGVWVGFGDGHLEFARNNSELEGLLEEASLFKKYSEAKSTPTDEEMAIRFPPGTFVRDSLSQQAYVVNADGSHSERSYADPAAGKVAEPPSETSSKP